MSAYYNENNPAAAAWLRNLIRESVIADGVVDERSIVDVQPADLVEFTQCHFFAGIGGWSYALRLAGWPDDRPVWTGSCPCQPFSVAAGQGKGFDDERHLWPQFERLIRGGKPSVVFGEQVASKLGREWLAGVRTDLEALGYEVGAADLCAAGVGAPHIRQRLYWVADTNGKRAREFSEAVPARESESGGISGGLPNTTCNGWQQESTDLGRRSERNDSQGESGRIAEHSDGGGLADMQGKRCGEARGDGQRSSQWIAYGGETSRVDDSAGARCDTAGEWPESKTRHEARMCGPECGCADGGLGHADNARPQGRRVLPERADERAPWASSLGNWIPCADGKARRIKPGLEPLAHGVPGRVAALRGYGNAIVPQVAEIFIRSYEECRLMRGSLEPIQACRMKPQGCTIHAGRG